MVTIGQVAKKMNLSISTLRYYDKEHILPAIKRNNIGVRLFDDSDIEALRVIECLKVSGMKLNDIKIFMRWCIESDKTIKKRLDMFNQQECAINDQINRLNKALNMIKFKKWYYQTALNDNTEKNVKKMDITNMPREIQQLYKQTESVK